MIERFPAPRIARMFARLAGAMLLTAAAFSAAQSPAASDAAAGPARPSPAAATPATPLPAADAAAETGKEPVLPAPPVVDVALVLPLENEAYARAADAVRSGFMAAAEAAGASASCLVIGHGEDGVLGAFEAARKAGAKVVVGPLLRDDLKVVAQLALDLPWTLALNQLDDSIPASPRIFTFALGVEGDARVIARRMRETAVQNVVVVGGETPLMKRFAGAFVTAWLLEGGGAPNVFAFDASPDALAALRRDLGRKPPDAALLAMDGGNATLAKPYMGTVAGYASGLVFERQSAATQRELDGLSIVEIPWIVTPDAEEFGRFPKREFGSAALVRLYALGLDAFRVAKALQDGPPQRFVLDGATGRITLVEGRAFAREGRLAIYRAGQLVPLDGAR
jgi:outer membrane PBP1 activator LpoA protein